VRVRYEDGEWRYYLGRDREPTDSSMFWHVSGYDVPGSPVGLSPIGHAAASIALGLEAQRHGLDWFDHGAHPSAILYAEQQLDAATAQTIKDRVKASWRSGEPAVLGSGLKWEAVQVAPEESQFLETVNANASMVCQWFGVPPEMVGVATSGSSVTYANREQRALDFLTFTLRPWLVRLEEALTRLTPRPYIVKFNAGALLKTDLKTRYESYALALNAEQPWLTVDEVRRLEDRPPIPPTEVVA
jgi:HK97 family phage portal protein